MTMYKVTTTDGLEDYFDADNIGGALELGRLAYGTGIAARPAYYGEWDCGLDCGYDASGEHYWIMADGEKTYSRETYFQNKKFGSKDI